MVKKYINYTLLLVFFALISNAQKEHSFVREGNKFYADSNFIVADSLYAKASEINPNSIEAQYNSANAKYTQQDYAGAITGYENIIPQLDSEISKAQSYHNLGNAYLKSQKLEEAIEAYKNALRIQPNDSDTRYNLAYATSLLKKNLLVGHLHLILALE